MRTFLLVAVLVGLPMQAQAAKVFYGGNSLVTFMHEWEKALAGHPGSNIYQAGQYRGYLSAAADASSTAGLICLPDGGAEEHVEAIVSAYLKAHPTEWHLPAISIVRKALVEAFPCR